MSKKSKLAGNGSLSQLADLVKKAGIQLKSPGDASLGVQETAAHEEMPYASTDEEHFEGAMKGVRRAAWRHDPFPSSEPLLAPPGNPDSEGLRLMQAAIAGDPPLEVLDHPEYIEGWIGPAGKRFLPKLRNGQYSIQGQIDLHGLSRAEAQRNVEDFVIRMSRFRPCCVKIIHGRGINSPSDKAVLKESLGRWLSARRLSRRVVAYASAPFSDGGVGAVYVLLRKHKS